KGLAQAVRGTNKDFRYQLTPMGAPGPNLHIAQGVTKKPIQDSRRRFWYEGLLAGDRHPGRTNWQRTTLLLWSKTHGAKISAFWMHKLRDSVRRSTDRLRRNKRKRKRLCQRKVKEWRNCGRSFKRKSKPAAEYFLPANGELIMTPLARDSRWESALRAAYGAMSKNSIPTQQSNVWTLRHALWYMPFERILRQSPLAIITSVALTVTVTLSPFFSFNSSALFRVITDSIRL